MVKNQLIASKYYANLYFFPLLLVLAVSFPLYSTQLGDVDEEAPLKNHFRELEIREKKFSNDHPSVATTLNNIGLVYDEQGKHEEALNYYRKALAIKEKKLGSDHPLVATTRNVIDVLCKKKNQQALSSGNCLLM